MILAERLRGVQFGKSEIEVLNFSGNYNGSGLTTYTFSAVSIGEARSTRKIIVGIAARASSSSRTISSVTVGGISGTLIGYELNTTGGYLSGVYFYLFEVPTGTTADIVIAWSGTMVRCAIGVWTVDNLSSTPYATKSAEYATNLNLSLNAKKGGFVTAVGYDNSTGSISISGLTPDYTGSGMFVCGSSLITVDETPRTIIVTVDEYSYSVAMSISWESN
ncbi:MAG TPA: hypothetical protein CFH81_02135 [Sulfurovum sp. UBA12169]|nr:MAG TPA: hypothetical protein CFH81_02135 [Sulfurovum sp. UBA12169]